MLSVHIPFIKDTSSERCFPSSSERGSLFFQSTYVNTFISFSADLDYTLSHNQRMSYWYEGDEEKEREELQFNSFHRASFHDLPQFKTFVLEFLGYDPMTEIRIHLMS